MDENKSKDLRKPFPPESIGKLPKKNKETGRYIYLDFVGHATVTDRLLSVDPEWNWEPMGVDQFGLPVLDADGNLWIRLTVCGLTRLGVGDGPNMKERIGDALRNAAMRFGVALDLWSKTELESSQDQHPDPAPEMPVPDDLAKRRAWDLTKKFKGEDRGQRTAFFNAALQARGVSPDTATDADYTALADEWAALDPKESPR